MGKSSAKVGATVALTASKVKRLIVKNFRCIGPDPVEIDLDDIVVLVGPNNAGKSTILRAYEVVMSHGSAEGRLKIEDFPGEQCDASCAPEIELQTYVFDNPPARQWLHTEESTGRTYIRERWRWDEVGKDPKRQGHRVDGHDWDEKVPWGAPSVANSRRPIPHHVDAFDRPEEQGAKITAILSEILLQKATQKEGEEASAIDTLAAKVRELQRKIVKDAADEIEGLELSLSGYMSEIFAGFRVTLDARTEEISERSVGIFNTKPLLRMGPEHGHLAPLEKQGSGARRTLLWSALKIATERASANPRKQSKAKSAQTDGMLADEGIQPYSRPHVLLLDEPEICLHPTAVRDACRVLYDLAQDGTGWQVMVTTHSPAFIDISRDNTTVVRVERTETGAICGTTVFRPERVGLSDDDKETLKYLNQWDPYVAEFFFGGRTILVEGDTEYSAFREIVEADRKAYRDVHVVRARGKYIIPILAKIMNHFGGHYAVLHDTDRPKTYKGSANGAWKANETILNVCAAAPKSARVRLAASLIDFEHAIFGVKAAAEKPFNTVRRIRENASVRGTVEEVLRYLLFERDEPPIDTIVEWKSVEELEASVLAFDDVG
ncbi:ATP-dependent nuclease [Stenotrophomonas maltophilia]|uniref:ATP-dependent nuclease n=1 Tax=Stenotrophomonas maltophilia TaxID=40324 RepID=UPI002553D390|nr:AAA family ATPase [Stenotrophomonas maltophilia]